MFWLNCSVFIEIFWRQSIKRTCNCYLFINVAKVVDLQHLKHSLKTPSTLMCTKKKATNSGNLLQSQINKLQSQINFTAFNTAFNHINVTIISILLHIILHCQINCKVKLIAAPDPFWYFILIFSVIIFKYQPCFK